MKLIKSLVLSNLFLAVIFIAGCNKQLATSNEPIDVGRQLSKFSLPLGANLNTAALHIYITRADGETVNIYAIS
jgi:hypothetical protein